MLNSEENLSYKYLHQKRNYTSKNVIIDAEKTKENLLQKKSYSLPSLDNNNNYLDNIKKILGGVKKCQLKKYAGLSLWL